MQPYVMIRHVHKSKTPFCGSCLYQTLFGIHMGPGTDHVVVPVFYAPHVTQLWLKKLYAN